MAVIDLEANAATAAAALLHDARAIGLAADVTDRGALRQAVAATVKRFGGLDVVLANAGIATTGATFRAMSTESFERVIDVDLMGVVNTVEVALPEIIRRKGHVVLVASVYAFSNGVGATPYAMSNAAVEQFGRALRVELVQHEASASVAYFGFIDTEMVNRSVDEDAVFSSMLAAFPNVLQKRLPPGAAGEAIATGIERRAPRIIRPRIWVLMSALRGILNPLTDIQAERDAKIQTAARANSTRARARSSGPPLDTPARTTARAGRRPTCRRLITTGQSAREPSLRLSPMPLPRHSHPTGSGLFPILSESNVQAAAGTLSPKASIAIPRAGARIPTRHAESERDSRCAHASATG